VVLNLHLKKKRIISIIAVVIIAFLVSTLLNLDTYLKMIIVVVLVIIFSIVIDKLMITKE